MSSTTSAFRPSLQRESDSQAGILGLSLNVPVVTLIGYVSLFAIAFGNLVDVETENSSIGFGGQALIKVMFLALGGLYGGVGVLTDMKVRRLLLSFPMMWMSLLLLFFFIAVPTSPTVFSSLASTISIACVLTMTATALVQLGVKNVMRTVFYGASTFVLGSWLAYWFMPSVGVFLEATTEGQFIHRMGGLAHPNTLGQTSGVTLVLGLLLYRDDKKFSWFRALVIVAAAAALIGSLSRTSLLATIFAVVMVFRMHIFQRRCMLTAIACGVAGIILLIAASMFTDIESKVGAKLGMLSKSGETSELTSATGRTEIWAKTIELIAQRPAQGYGAATSKVLLKDYSRHTHNLILNIMLSTGVIGGLIAVWMCFERLIRLFVARHPIADALVVLILVNGLFENVIFSILCGLPTIIWIIALALPTIEAIEHEEQNPRPTAKILRLAAR
ncbi:O-antigen ligase family protein [Mariniblastus sp.]|nr:O-antigen ligase family protein [Mariniblastus sp.]